MLRKVLKVNIDFIHRIARQLARNLRVIRRPFPPDHPMTQSPDQPILEVIVGELRFPRGP